METRAGLQQGCTGQPEGRTQVVTLERHDMVRRDGEDRGLRPAFRTSGWLRGRGCPGGSVPLVSKSPHTTAALWTPLNPQDVKKWCYPAHVWAFNPGTSSSPSSSGSRICCAREPLHTLRNRLCR